MNIKERNIDWSKLEMFSDKYGKRLTSFVTISPRGSITFNAGFVKESHKEVDNNNYALLSFHPDASVIVFDFTRDEKHPGALKLSKKTNIFMAAKSFFNRFGIKPEEVAGKYLPEKEYIPKRGDCWLIDLKARTDSEIN